MYITMDEELRFYAPIDVPYQKQLHAAAWRQTRDYWFTEHLDRATPFYEHFHPDLKALIANTEVGYAKSHASEPSADFTCPYPEGETPLPFQLASVEFILGRDNTLLAEDAGTGKSMMMALVANAMKAKRILLVCPASAKYNWAWKEWPRWTTLDLSVGVAESTNWPDTDVVIINFDILKHHKKTIDAIEWDYLIVDEAHRIKNQEAKRTCFILGGNVKGQKKDMLPMGLTYVSPGKYRSAPIRAKRRVFATATPMNRPIDLWTLIHACDPEGLGADKDHYESYYCARTYTQFGKDCSGADNLMELGARLRNSIMIRHDAEKELGLPKLREELFLLPPVEIVLKAEDSFVKENMDALLGFSERQGKQLSKQSNPEEFLKMIGDAILANVPLIGEPAYKVMFTKFAEMRKATGIAKVPDAVRFIKDVTDDGTLPVVIFAYHREVMELLREEFPNASYVIGGLGGSKRQEEVDKFQGDPRRGIEPSTNEFLGNIDAAGEAVTLTRAAILVFVEMDWRGTMMIQARKRIHRIGQDRECTAYYLAAAKSFDANVTNSAFSKMANIKEAIEL